MNRVLSIKRLWYMARKDVFDTWRSHAVAAAAVFGAMILFAFLGVLIEGKRSMDYNAYFIGTIFIWGCIAASRVFGELHDKEKNEAFLLLPVSALEKTLVRLLTVSVFLPLVIIVLITVASVISEIITSLVFGLHFAPFNPFAVSIWRIIGYAIIVQSLFFLGAAWFKKAHFIKTVLAIIVFGIVFGILAGLIFRIVYAPYFDGFCVLKDIHLDIALLIRTRFPVLISVLDVMGKVLIYGLLAPFCWITAWFRVRETQSSYGI